MFRAGTRATGSGFGLPGIMRFISADTIVPDPANPQTLNRYSYALNNPAKYNDPTGHFTESEIKDLFNLGKWQDINALFERGGLLEGRWGWLEVLRQARWNDVLKFDDGTVGGFSASTADIRLRRPGHDLSEIASATDVGKEFDHYRLEKAVPETGEPTGEVFETDAWIRYDRVRLDLNKVDMPSLAFDGLGVFTGGLGDDLAEAMGKPAMKALDVTQNVGGTAYGIGVVANKIASGEAGALDIATGVTDIVSLFGGPFWNVLGIILNFGGTVSYGP